MCSTLLDDSSAIKGRSLGFANNVGANLDWLKLLYLIVYVSGLAFWLGASKFSSSATDGTLLQQLSPPQACNSTISSKIINKAYVLNTKYSYYFYLSFISSVHIINILNWDKVSISVKVYRVKVKLRLTPPSFNLKFLELFTCLMLYTW